MLTYEQEQAAVNTNTFLPLNMELQAVVMAGGRGSHMLDLTQGSRPKPFVLVGNKPLIWHTINMLEAAGFSEAIVITLNCVKTYMELTLKEFNMSTKVIGISEESDLDTVDSLCLVKDYIKSDVVILSCDLLTDLPFHRLADVHRLHDSSVTMLLCPAKADIENIPGVKPKKKGQQKQREFIGLCPTDRLNHRVLFLLNEADLEDDLLPINQSLMREFPKFQVRTDLHDAHVYVVKKWLINYLAYNKVRSSLRSEVLPYVVQKQFAKSTRLQNGTGEREASTVTDFKDIFSFVHEDREKDFIYDLTLAPHEHKVNSKSITCYAYVYEEGLCMNVNNISLYMEANRVVSKPDSTFLNTQTRVHPFSRVDEKSQVGADCLVGERTEISERTSVKRSVVGRNCTIGSGVRLSNCVIMDRVNIGNGSSLNGCILCDDVSIGEKCELKDCFVGDQKKLPAMSRLSKESLVESQAMMEFE